MDKTVTKRMTAVIKAHRHDDEDQSEASRLKRAKAKSRRDF
jgi:hypothetical protein